VTQGTRQMPVPPASPAGADVAVARGLATFVARLARQRKEAEAQMPEPAVWVPAVEHCIVVLIETFSGLIPEYRHRSARELLNEEGPIRLVGRIAECEPQLLARQGMRALLSLRLALVAVDLGATVPPPPPVAGVLDTFFAASHRRAARHLIERHLRCSGARYIQLDLAATWRTGSNKLIRALDEDAAARGLVEGMDRRRLGLMIWLLLADCWTARANPVSVAYLLAVQWGYERWRRGSDAFRQALTEALVIATRDDLDLAGLEDVNSVAWGDILTGDLLDWAGSILETFHQAMERPGQLASFRVFDFRATLKRAGRRGRRFETVEEHLVGLAYRVVRLDNGEGEPPAGEDPGDRIPEVYELRARVANAKLTKRERQVLALCASDMDYNTIGKELGISPSTARVLMFRARRAMGSKQRPKRGAA
jgi:DNA-directed RNA polymerase specialized sigma24 family protein